jgi:hypothetical protein
MRHRAKRRAKKRAGLEGGPPNGKAAAAKAQSGDSGAAANGSEPTRARIESHSRWSRRTQALGFGERADSDYLGVNKSRVKLGVNKSRVNNMLLRFEA